MYNDYLELAPDAIHCSPCIWPFYRTSYIHIDEGHVATGCSRGQGAKGKAGDDRKGAAGGGCSRAHERAGTDRLCELELDTLRARTAPIVAIVADEDKDINYFDVDEGQQCIRKSVGTVRVFFSLFSLFYVF